MSFFMSCLHEGHERGVDDADDGERHHPGHRLAAVAGGKSGSEKRMKP